MTTNLPALPTSSDRSADIGVVVEPVREIVEVRTDDERAVYVVEPVVATDAIVPTVLADLTDVADTAPTTGQVLGWTGSTWAPASVGVDGVGGVVAFRRSPALPVISGAGTAGAWTLGPILWRMAIPAAAGDLLDWNAASVLLGGGPAAIDLVCLKNNVPFRYLSSGTDTPAALGSMYSQGDFGAVRLPTQRWQVLADELVNGTVTLALAYRAAVPDAGTGVDTEPLAIGHAQAPARLTVTNLGPVGAASGGSGGSSGGSSGYAPITWGDLGVTPGAPAPTDPDSGTIPPEYTVGSRLFFGDGPPTELALTSTIATLAVVSDVYLDRLEPALWAMFTEGWQKILDLRQDTMLYLGFGDPNVVPGNYKRVHNVGIDVSTLDIYEFPEGAPQGMQEE